MRKHYIDNLRWSIILLLIPFHAAQAFKTWTEPNYIEFGPNKMISSIIVFFGPFVMQLLFLFAGMSMRYALKKRSYAAFAVERINRYSKNQNCPKENPPSAPDISVKTVKNFP